ncbi:MAG: hypothetical protein WD009_06335 [Phycisphaeraceae bacterium]
MIRKDDEGEAVETLEGGHIYFIYRPRVEQEQVEDADDIQQLYMVLKPKGKGKYRLIVLGRRELPDISKRGRSRHWGYVDMVANRPKAVEEAFDEQHYETTTRGERVRPAGRPVGEGVYRIVRHGDHTHLIYGLELPAKPGEAQKALNIEAEASYIISIRNPEKPAPPSAGLPKKDRADLPRALQERFEGRQFFDADPPDFLNHEGVELLLISAAEDVKEELGIELDTDDESESTADVFNDLRMERSEHPVEPLLKGKWA